MTAVPQWLRRRLTHALVSGALPAPVARTVHRQIGADPSWRASYDELRAVERTAANEEVLSESQLDLIEAAVLRGVDDAPKGSPMRAWGATAAMLGAAVVVLVILAPRAPSGDDLVARGSGAAAVGLRVQCLRAAPSSGAPEALSTSVLGATRAGASLRCPKASMLAFSVTNLSDEVAQVFLIGVRDDGELLWFAPFEQGASSVPMPVGSVDELLDVVATTGGMDLGRRVSLFALFDDGPLDGAALARQLRDARGRGLALHALDRLPVDVAAQSRANLLIVDREDR